MTVATVSPRKKKKNYVASGINQINFPTLGQLKSKRVDTELHDR